LSNIRAGTISGVNGTDPVTLTKQAAVKTHAAMKGDGTVTIHESLNASSIADNGSGLYTLNFTNSYSTNRFSLVLHAVHDSSFPAGCSSYDYSRTTGDADINTSNSTHNGWSDCGTFDAMLIGDLA